MEEKPEFITGDWQVTVEVYRDHVVKIPKTIQEIELQIRKAGWTKDFNDATIKNMAIESLKKHVQSVEAIFNSGIPLEFFANPKLLSANTIHQDRVVIIENILNTEIDLKNLFSKCIQSYTKLWEYGLYDTSWNFTINCGINKDDAVVFIDIGECATNFKTLSIMIKEKRWQKSYSFK